LNNFAIQETDGSYLMLLIFMLLSCHALRSGNVYQNDARTQ